MAEQRNHANAEDTLFRHVTAAQNAEDTLFRHVTAAQNAEDTLFCQIDHRRCAELCAAVIWQNNVCHILTFFQVFSFLDTLIERLNENLPFEVSSLFYEN